MCLKYIDGWPSIFIVGMLLEQRELPSPDTHSHTGTYGFDSWLYNPAQQLIVISSSKSSKSNPAKVKGVEGAQPLSRGA